MLMHNLGGQTKSIMVFSEMSYWPLPCSPQPQFQGESTCDVFVMNISFSFILKLELVTITKISHVESL